MADPGDRVPPVTAKERKKERKKRKKIAKNLEKEGEKIRKKRKKKEGSFTLPLLTDTAGYATGRSDQSQQELTVGPIFNRRRF